MLSGINLVTTILKTRAPGMGLMRMPMFCWTSLASNLLIVAAFPILTATLAMLICSTATSAFISSPTKPAATS